MDELIEIKRLNKTLDSIKTFIVANTQINKQILLEIKNMRREKSQQR